MTSDEIDVLDAVDNLIHGLQQFQTQIIESKRKNEIVEGILKNTPKFKGKISGKVKNSVDQKTLEFATVSLVDFETNATLSKFHWLS